MSDVLWERRSPAAEGLDDRVAWVVDLASRRVIRVQAVLARAPAEAVAISSGKEWPAISEPPAVTRVRAARQGLPDRDVRPILNGQHQQQNQGRCESVSKPQENAAPFDRSRIEARAYALYCARGCVDGLDVDDWLEAEQQLRAEGGIEGPTPEAEPAGVDESGSD